MRLLLAYVITKALGATVTLDSNDVRHAFVGGGSGRVAARTRAAPPEPGCVERRVGDTHPELGNTDDVFVRRCGPPPVTNATRVALCVPTLYGAYLRAPSTMRWAAAWLEHYRSLGVAHFFVYAAAPVRGLDAADVTLLDVAWLGGCRALPKTHHARCAYTQNRSLVYWGQNWVLNDCHQRAAAQGFGWALAVDLDEVLELGPNRTLADLARDPVDVHTFGSSAERPRPCGAPCAAGAAPPPARPHCLPRYCGDCERCLGHRGRRKHLSRVARVHGANIHFVSPRACAPPCQVRDHAATNAWLRHFGGRKSRSGMRSLRITDGCPRTYCETAGWMGPQQ
ncbi:unnamed protein product [Pelagomonas calceolata]|uniref:Glycosyltransferase family 92 protein n=2 Tax=Pelagomonas calceolata TaxID=35677 RepID=A0A8J2SYA1_9STRA|nr:unnamed protein product [Pelagomonas calceolata]